MKKHCFPGLLAFPLLLGLSGCAFFSGLSSDSWGSAGGAGWRGTLGLAELSVHRLGDREPVAAEIRDMAPLFFMEQGFAMREEGFDYAVEIRVREREYSPGWKAVNSLSLELCIWPGQGDRKKEPPLAAGRAVITGNQTLLSSKTLSLLFRTALEKALERLFPKEGSG